MKILQNMGRIYLIVGPAWALATFLVVAILAGCTTVPAESKQRAPVDVVGSKGRLDSPDRNAVLARLEETSNSGVVSTTLDEIATLSAKPLYLHNDVQLLIDGPETYEGMIASIKAAQHHVFLESYIFGDDEVGAMFAAALEEQSRKGVDVKVIYDSYGSGRSGNEIFEKMESAGVEVMEFNPVNPLKGGDEKFISYRDHRKILAVDGEVAYTGSINVTDVFAVEPEQARKSGEAPVVWRDTSIAVRGPAAVGLQQLFLDTWESLGEKTSAAHVPDGDERAGSAVVAIIPSEGGDDIQSQIFAAYLHAIEAAERRVWISQAYFVPNEHFLSHVKQAARRGVDVRINVPGVIDSDMAYHASRSRYDELLEAGVRIFEREGAALHAKTAVIDSIWSTVGSSNLDYLSLIHNDEVNAVIIDRPFAGQLEAVFAQDILRSREIVLSEWEERSIWKRLKENLSWLVKYWL